MLPQILRVTLPAVTLIRSGTFPALTKSFSVFSAHSVKSCSRGFSVAGAANTITRSWCPLHRGQPHGYRRFHATIIRPPVKTCSIRVGNIASLGTSADWSRFIRFTRSFLRFVVIACCAHPPLELGHCQRAWRAVAVKILPKGYFRYSQQFSRFAVGPRALPASEFISKRLCH